MNPIIRFLNEYTTLSLVTRVTFDLTECGGVDVEIHDTCHSASTAGLHCSIDHANEAIEFCHSHGVRVA